VRVSVIGIELLTIDARIVIASIDTYLSFAERVNQLDLTQTEAAGLKELARAGVGTAPHGRKTPRSAPSPGRTEIDSAG